LLFDKGDQGCEVAGINRDWPNGRGIYCNEDFSLVIWVNQQDHIKIIANECNGGDLNSLLGKMAEIHTVLDGVLKFQKDDSLGYLTTSPADLGTGLQIKVDLYLPFIKENELE